MVSPTSTEHTRRIGQGEMVAAIVVTLAAVFLHFVLVGHAGGLWRDEAGFVYLSTLPLPDLWAKLPHDHCPVLTPLIVRLWSGIGWAQTDFGLRILGLLIGLILMVSFWAASWTMRRGVPLIALALVALNETVIRSGDSLRAYGLGSALAVLSLAALWRLVRKPTPLSLCLAIAAAVLSVQCLYQNAIFVFAGCCGGVAVAAVRKQWREALYVFGVGMTAAMSLMPYLPIIRRAQDWYELEKAGFDLAIGWQKISAAMESPMPHFRWIWVVFCIVAIVAMVRVLFRAPSREGSGEASRELIVFGGTALIIGLLGFGIFLETAGLPTQAWYYVPLLAFMAMCLDAVLPTVAARAQPVFVVFTVLTAGAAMVFVMPEMKCRQTNGDLIARELAQKAGPDDYIVIHPWNCGITFQRYYQGTTPWTTLPPIDDHALHRYDLFKIKMQMENPIQPVLDRIAATLQSGHRVWLVGNFSFPQSPPEILPPAPDASSGWFDLPYSEMWSAQTGYFIVSHTEGGEIVPVSADCVNSFEDLRLMMVRGWKETRVPTE